VILLELDGMISMSQDLLAFLDGMYNVENMFEDDANT